MAKVSRLGARDARYAAGPGFTPATNSQANCAAFTLIIYLFLERLEGIQQSIVIRMGLVASLFDKQAFD